MAKILKLGRTSYLYKDDKGNQFLVRDMGTAGLQCVCGALKNKHYFCSRCDHIKAVLRYLMAERQGVLI